MKNPQSGSEINSKAAKVTKFRAGNALEKALK